MQDSYKITLSCKNIAKRLFFAWILQDIYFMVEPHKITNICKKFARNLFLARILQDIYHLQESCKISLLARILQKFTFWFFCISFEDIQKTRNFTLFNASYCYHILTAVAVAARLLSMRTDPSNKKKEFRTLQILEWTLQTLNCMFYSQIKLI